MRFVVAEGQSFVTVAKCLGVIHRGALEVCALDLHDFSSWSQQLLDAGIRFFQAPDRETPLRVRLNSDAPPETEYYDLYHEFYVNMLHPVRDDQMQVFSARFNEVFGKCQGLGSVCFLHGVSMQNGRLCVDMRFSEGSIRERMAWLKGGRLPLLDFLRGEYTHF